MRTTGGAIGLALAAALLAGCAAQAAPKKAPPIAINDDPYPSIAIGSVSS